MKYSQIKKLFYFFLILNIFLFGLFFWLKHLQTLQRLKTVNYSIIPKVEKLKTVEQPKEKEIVLPDISIIDTSRKAKTKEEEKTTTIIKPFKIEIERITTKGIFFEAYKKPFLSRVTVTDTGTVSIKKYTGLKIAAAAAIIGLTFFTIFKIKKNAKL